MSENLYSASWFGSELCIFCKYFSSQKSPSGLYACNAFPDGIPIEIAYGTFDHRKSHPADHGIQFELKAKYDKLPDWVEEDYAQSDEDEDDEAESAL